jgi:hypothetical protein
MSTMLGQTHIIFRVTKIVKPEMGEVIGTDGRWEKVYKLQLENLNARE